MAKNTRKNQMELFHTFSPKKPVDYHIDPNNADDLVSLVEKLGNSFMHKNALRFWHAN